MSSVKAAFVNPFLQSAFDQIAEALGELPTQGQPTANPFGLGGEQVNAMVQVQGDMEGQIILAMSLATADRIASAILNETVKTFDDQAAGAVCELVNKISGSGVEILAKENQACTASEATIMKGPSGESKKSKNPAFVIPITFSQGEIKLIFPTGELSVL
jgi:CheY-specific phosphatase CheX